VSDSIVAGRIAWLFSTCCRFGIIRRLDSRIVALAPARR
jgi:hypothetical protein